MAILIGAKPVVEGNRHLLPGQKVNLSLDSKNQPTGTVTWTLPGDPIQRYIHGDVIRTNEAPQEAYGFVDVSRAFKVDLSVNDYKRSATAFYWLKPGTYVVRVETANQGETEAEFIVDAPVATMAIQHLGEWKYFPATGGLPAFLGLVGPFIPTTNSYDHGIISHISVTIPPRFPPGNLYATQLVELDWQQKGTPLQFAHEQLQVCADNHEYYQKKVDRSGRAPFAVIDDPKFPLPSPTSPEMANVTGLTLNYRFKTHLMFQPFSAGSIPVALKMFEWGIVSNFAKINNGWVVDGPLTPPQAPNAPAPFPNIPVTAADVHIQDYPPLPEFTKVQTNGGYGDLMTYGGIKLTLNGKVRERVVESSKDKVKLRITIPSVIGPNYFNNTALPLRINNFLPNRIIFPDTATIQPGHDYVEVEGELTDNGQRDDFALATVTVEANIINGNNLFSRGLCILEIEDDDGV